VFECVCVQCVSVACVPVFDVLFSTSRLHFFFFFFIIFSLFLRIRIPKPSRKYFGSIVRRLYRTFAHAYFHHRDVFDHFEVCLCVCVCVCVFLSRVKKM